MGLYIVEWNINLHQGSITLTKGKLIDIRLYPHNNIPKEESPANMLGLQWQQNSISIGGLTDKKYVFYNKKYALVSTAETIIHIIAESKEGMIQLNSDNQQGILSKVKLYETNLIPGYIEKGKQVGSEIELYNKRNNDNFRASWDNLS